MSKERGFGWELSEAGHWTLRVVVIGGLAVIAAGLLLMLIVYRVSNNDNAKIQRDKTIKIACINQGKQVINGNCLVAPRI